MESSLKSYKVLLKVKSPLYIGSGQTVGKKDYIFDKSTEEAKIINMNKLSLLIYKKNLFKSYEDFMCKDTLPDINSWLRKNNFTSAEIESIIDYRVLANKTKIIGKNREINTFVKDSYNKPYIPGSSLKGCLRTVLLAYRIRQNPKKYQRLVDALQNADFKGKNRYLSNELQAIEVEAFNTIVRDDPKYKKSNAVNDSMQSLIVGDSKPLSTSKLVLCEKADVKPDGSESKINIYYECIVPDTVISFPLTINTAICNDISVEEIRSAVKLFAEDYYSYYVSKFNLPKHQFTNTIWLGGNSGFPTKTVLYNIFEGSNIEFIADTLNKVGHTKNKDDYREYGISPHSINMTYFNGQKMRMGEATITIKEIEP